jgi:hypothetical protein
MASAMARRKMQNKGVKAGTVRVGAGGKTVRRYNAKTGRWDVTKKDVKATGTTLRPTAGPKKPTGVPASLTKTGSRTMNKSQAASGSRYAGMAAGPAAAKKDKGPRRSGESIRAYNDRIRNAPLRDFFANLGSSGASRPEEKAAARNQAAYMSGKPPVRPKPKTATQKAAEAAREKANLEKAKAAARAQAKRASGK